MSRILSFLNFALLGLIIFRLPSFECISIATGERFVKLRRDDNTERDENLPMQITMRTADICDSWMRAITDDPKVFGSLFVLGDAACFRDRRHQYVGGKGDVRAPWHNSVCPRQRKWRDNWAHMARLLSRGYYSVSGTPPMLVEPKSVANMIRSEHLEHKWRRLRSFDVFHLCEFGVARLCWRR